MDSYLRQVFLTALTRDLELVFFTKTESLFIGPTGWEIIRSEIAPTRAEILGRLVHEAIEKLPSLPPDPLRGGIISCDCSCHLPIGMGGAAGKRSCIHCRLLA